MTQKKTTKKSLSGAKKVGIGVGLTAAAVAAAGAYFLYGSKDAVKNRKKVKSWVLKAKADVLEGLEKAENITEAEYRALVDAVGGAYSTAEKATRGEVRDFEREMKKHWGKIAKSGVVKKVIAPVKAVSKKPPVSKKAAPATKRPTYKK